MRLHIIDEIKKADPVLIRDVSLFDIYEGKNLGDDNMDKKAMAFKITLQSEEKTLSDSDMTTVQKTVFNQSSPCVRCN